MVNTQTLCSALLLTTVDTEGIAVIMCEQELVAKYQALSQGSKVLESCLHHNLSEHVNSEIGMGTITDIESAKRWLRDSFLYQRLRKNPDYYAIGNDQRSANWQDRMDDIVLANISKLQDHDLVKECDDSAKKTLATTEYGEIMSKVHGLLSHLLEPNTYQLSIVLHPPSNGILFRDPLSWSMGLF